MNLSKAEFLKLAIENSVIPLYRECACDFVTPVGFFSKVQSEYSFLLESVESTSSIGRYSFLGIHPKFAVSFSNGKNVIRDFDGDSFCEEGDPFFTLRKVIQRFKPIHFDSLPGFSGGAVGYLGYDLIAHIEKINLKKRDDLKIPDLNFIIPKVILAFDHFNHTIKFIYNAFVEKKSQAGKLYTEAEFLIKKLQGLLKGPVDLPLLPMDNDSPEASFESNMSREDFYAMVRKAKEHIVCGDTFQIVLSQRFHSPYPGDALTLYRALRMVNPSPYLFLIRYPDYSLIGSSPEILVKEEKGKVTIRPIAGTRKRTGDLEKDAQAEKDLLLDPKERAEHVMLVDLARNDISRVCGSVKPTELLVIERYAHIMHIVSNIEGQLSEGKDAFDLIRATFPAGTLSGAPKIRAMEIIETLEPTKRGPYGGAVCYFGFGGNFDSCIIIRTMLLKDKKAIWQAGAGVVYDSKEEYEYEETLIKARALLKALQVARNVE
jgi:anthranilate synthase component 1